MENEKTINIFTNNPNLPIYLYFLRKPIPYKMDAKIDSSNFYNSNFVSVGMNRRPID